jgi:hypothetical protein
MNTQYRVFVNHIAIRLQHFFLPLIYLKQKNIAYLITMQKKTMKSTKRVNSLRGKNNFRCYF